MAKCNALLKIDDKPTLRQLQCLKYFSDDSNTKKEFRLIRRVAKRWYYLGIALNFETHNIDIIKLEEGNIEDRCTKLLSDWLTKTNHDHPEEPRTWEALIEAMDEADCKKPAQELKDILSNGDIQELPKDTTAALEDVSYGDPQELSFVFADKMRGYQKELATPGLQGDSYIICAPTGSGKTLVAARIIEDHITKKRMLGEGKVVFMVQTRHLAQQQTSLLVSYIMGIRTVSVIGYSNLSIATLMPKVDVIVCTAGKLAMELESKKLSISDITLLIADECHHVAGHSKYAMCLEFLLQAKKIKSRIPQVVGLTASPGAGKGSIPSLGSAIAHQFRLCAHLNASSGIVMVTNKNNQQELLECIGKPKTHLEEISPREKPELFHKKVTELMEKYEKMIDFRVSLDRSSQKYQHFVQQRKGLAKMSIDPQVRNIISILEFLYQYNLALITYDDFTYENAIEVLQDLTLPPDKIATDLEKTLAREHKELLSFLDSTSLKKKSNPILDQVANILFDQFNSTCSQNSESNSKGIFFVREVRHTQYVRQWVDNHPLLKDIIRVNSVVGDGKAGMTKKKQQEVLEKFKDGKYNLLSATSVLEEGIDVPSCNFVIRFQFVTNEIAEVQAQGRARKKNSTMYTVISSQSPLRYQQLINEEKRKLILQAPLFVSALCAKGGQDFINQQQLIISEVEEKQRLAELKVHNKYWRPESVEIRCSKCKAFACKGSDVYKLDAHYVVPNEEFQQKVIDIRPHPRKREPVEGVHRTHKIYCKKCNNDLGVCALWTAKGDMFPVLKCSSFVFNNALTPLKDGLLFKQWSKVPFKILIIDTTDFSSDEDD